MTTWKVWADRMARNIADTAKARRVELGLTAAEVAERTAVGKPLSRAVISDLETGRKRTLEVSELVTLAAALEMPPAALLFPDVLSDDAEILPGKRLAELAAFGWFIGAGRKLGMVEEYDYAPEGVETSSSMRIPLEILRIDLEIAEQQFQLTRVEKLAERTTNDRVRETLEQQAAAIRGTIEVLDLDREVQNGMYRGRKIQPDA